MRSNNLREWSGEEVRHLATDEDEERKLVRGCLAIPCPVCGANPLQVCLTDMGTSFELTEYGIPDVHYGGFRRYDDIVRDTK